jgi:hypothetical protein
MSENESVISPGKLFEIVNYILGQPEKLTSLN